MDRATWKEQLVGVPIELFYTVARRSAAEGRNGVAGYFTCSPPLRDGVAGYPAGMGVTPSATGASSERTCRKRINSSIVIIGMSNSLAISMSS